METANRNVRNHAPMDIVLHQKLVLVMMVMPKISKECVKQFVINRVFLGIVLNQIRVLAKKILDKIPLIHICVHQYANTIVQMVFVLHQISVIV